MRKSYHMTVWGEEYGKLRDQKMEVVGMFEGKKEKSSMIKSLVN